MANVTGLNPVLYLKVAGIRGEDIRKVIQKS